VETVPLAEVPEVVTLSFRPSKKRQKAAGRFTHW
jgi:hypothetical protein